MTVQNIPGAAYDLDQQTIVQASTAFTFSNGIGGVDALATLTVKLSDATHTARVGDRKRILATGGDVTVTDDNFAILGGSFVPQGTSADYELALAPGGTFAWVALGAGGGFGTGEIYVANLAALAALPSDSFIDQVRAHVETLDGTFELDKTSTATPDWTVGTTTRATIVAAETGNWLRIEAASKRWSQLYLSVANGGQGGVFIDPFAGDDQNTGADVAGHRLKTCAEACIRTHQIQAGRNYRFKITDTDPAFGGVPSTDRWRPSVIFEQNVEDVLTVPPAGAGQAGNDQIINMTLEGDDIKVATGTFTSNYAKTTTGVQAQMVDTVLGNAGITANLGKKVVILTVPGGGDATAVGAVAFIGAGPAQDSTLAAGTARITQFVKTDGSEVATGAGGLPTGTTYKIVNPLKFAGALMQLPSSGRWQLKNLEFTAPSAAPANQELFTARLSNVLGFGCKWSRPADTSLGASAFTACAFTDNTGDGLGTLGLFTANVFSAPALVNSLLLHVNAEVVNGSNLTSASAYLEKSNLQTAAPTSFFNYGSFSVAGTTARGAVIIVGGTGGLGIYNSPVGSASLRIKDGGLCKASADIHGTAPGGGSGGIAILVEGGSSELLILDTVTPTIGTGAGGTVVANDQINIANPGGTAGMAVRTGTGVDISNATNATPIVVTTATAHGLTSGDIVFIVGVIGNNAANNSWAITVTNATTFSLTGSAGNAAYVSGGIVAMTGSSPPRFLVHLGEPVFQDAAFLRTWANWVGLGPQQFGRYASNPMTGCRVVSTAAA